ncbi:hypothetical protein M4S82_10350 [Planococcus sp. MERTA32b]|nr:hypothetical protein [Planococcus sp. MER TA 32b]
MQRVIGSILVLVIGIMGVSGCGKSGSDATAFGEEGFHHKDDEMIGWVVNTKDHVIEMEISEWKKRDSNSETEEGYAYYASFSEETAIAYEDGTEASVDDIKDGHNLMVFPPAKGNDFKGHADEIVILDMTYEQKYEKFLAHRGGFNIVVMHESGTSLPDEMRDPLFENAGAILAETGQRVGTAWIEYNPDYVVDYKEELDIEQFPVILVYSQEELLFKSTNVDEVYEFLEEIKEESSES